MSIGRRYGGQCYAEGGQASDEYREGYDSSVEYRYADFPLALGEAIMLNHALSGALLHLGATPITDDSFHIRALAHKLQRATQDPLIRQAIGERAAQRQCDLPEGLLWRLLDRTEN